MEHDIVERKITVEEVLVLSEVLKKHKKPLLLYADKLLWWNRKVNLVSRDVSHETLKEHIKHSLCVSLMSEFEDSSKIVDAGSGGGLPGLPLSIAFDEKEFVLNDIIVKKVFVLNDLVNKLNLKEWVSTNAGSVGDIQTSLGSVIVTKHAFKIFELYEFIKDKEWSSMIFLKGKEEAREELKQVEESFKVEILDLETDFMGDFYKGKSVVQVKRIR